MRKVIHKADAVEVGGDAFLYSTNTQLALTGGVGASLRARFGMEIQQELHRTAKGRTVAVGDVFETSLPGLPWHCIFHAIATDEVYHTDPEVVSRILRRCFDRCGEFRYSRLVTSALGTGYGDLDVSDFVRIVDAAVAGAPGCLKELCIVCHDQSDYEKLLAVSGYETEA
jgi:O-acetyl-ADP-ribose deacetylase (regulator of RNase III)